MKTVKERFEKKFLKGANSSCWEWMAGKDRDGYGKFRVAKQDQRAHRVAYQLYVGEIPAGLCVCHHCDNPGCVNPEHLFPGTNFDNMRDCENKVRRVHPSGEENYSAKLNEAQVIEIRARYSEGATQSELAKEFGVAQSTISAIVLRLIWAKI